MIAAGRVADAKPIPCRAVSLAVADDFLERARRAGSVFSFEQCRTEIGPGGDVVRIDFSRAAQGALRGFVAAHASQIVPQVVPGGLVAWIERQSLPVAAGRAAKVSIAAEVPA